MKYNTYLVYSDNINKITRIVISDNKILLGYPTNI